MALADFNRFQREAEKARAGLDADLDDGALIGGERKLAATDLLDGTKLLDRGRGRSCGRWSLREKRGGGNGGK